MDVFITAIVSASKLHEARSLGSCGFRVGLSPTGVAPATHYISSGKIPEDAVPALELICQVVYDTDPYEVIASAGLKII